MPTFGEDVSIFANEDALREDWLPETLPEREAELEQLHYALAPATRGSTPHNVFLYGKTGQGKTAATSAKLTELEDYAENQADLDLTVVTFSCENITSSYTLASKLVLDITGSEPRGYDQHEVFSRLFDALDAIGGTILLVLDEIDNIGMSDDILYSLPRARSKGQLTEARVSVIGISNDFQFRDNLSPKVKDTLCDEEIEFTPYNADQLTSILRRRVDVGFVDGVVMDGTIPYCAAKAAQEKGSARQAIRLLYKAGELALQRDRESVDEALVDEAYGVLERERIEDGLRNLTVQDTLCLAGVVSLECKDAAPGRTKHVYREYERVSDMTGDSTLVQRRVRDHLQELDMQGFLMMQTHNRGPEGVHYYTFSLNVDLDTTLAVLADNPRYVSIADTLRTTARRHDRL